MKRFLSFLLAMLLIVGMVPFSAMALEPGVIVETCPYYSNPLYPDVVIPETLNADDAVATAADDIVYHSTMEKAAAEVRKQMVARKNTIVVGLKTSNADSGMHKEIFDKAVSHTGVYNEGDSLLWVYAGYGGYYSHYGDKCVFTYYINYYTDAKQEKALDAAEEALLAELNPTGTAYEKLTTVYQWICENIEYDYEHLEYSNYFLMYTAYAALIDRTSVCQGYAVLLYRLALRMGIDCRVITGIGNGGGHAWNIVRLGNKYYNLDATWDAIWVQSGLPFEYYLRCNDNFYDHYRDDEYDTAEFNKAYPMSSKDFDSQNDNSGSTEVSAPNAEIKTDSTTGKPVITWEKTRGAVKYEVYRATSKNGTYSCKKTTTGSKYTNTAAVAGKTYYYYVRAIAENGEYADSNIVHCTCTLARTTMTVSNKASTGKITVKWEPVDGATEYEVWRATSKSGDYSRLITTSKTSVTNTSAKAGKTYYYKVRAICDVKDATASFSDVKSRTCDLPQTNLTLSNKASTGKIVISWEPVEGATKYEVWRATSKNGDFSCLTTTSKTSVTNTSAKSGKTYYYKVRAICDVKDAAAAFSDAKSRTCDLAQTGVRLSNNASTGKIVVRWEAVEGATQYEVWRATSKNGEFTLMSTTDRTQITNKSAKVGKTYYYKVRAICGVDSATAAFSDVKYRTCDLPCVEASASLSSKKPKISWEMVEGAVSYEVYRATSQNGSYSLRKTTTDSYYKDTKATSGKTYYYKVIALASNTAANSDYSAVVSIKSK